MGKTDRQTDKSLAYNIFNKMFLKSNRKFPQLFSGQMKIQFVFNLEMNRSEEEKN